jgi:hypothetical protein
VNDIQWPVNMIGFDSSPSYHGRRDTVPLPYRNPMWRRCSDILPASVSTYFGVFYLIGHWFAYAGSCAAVAVVSTLLLYFTWYIPLRREEPERSKPPSR